jgi:tetrathionate reductase subunit B
MPACISTCVAQARYFGDANDPKSDVSRMLKERPHQTLKPELGTKPNVYYLGLDVIQTYLGQSGVQKGGR